MSTPLDDWQQIHSVLHEAAFVEPSAHKAFLLGLNNLDPLTRLKTAETYFRTSSEEITSAVQRWHIGQPLPKLSGEAQVFFQARAAAASVFVLKVWPIERIDDIPFVPANEWTPERIIKYLLTEWWDKCGWQEAFCTDFAFSL